MASAHPDKNQHSPMSEGDDYLTALPNELLGGVVEQLSIREIGRLHSVNRHFREFVDTNQGKLTQGLISYHRTRINEEYKLFTDLSECDFVDALRRYDSHYSLVCQPEPLSRDPFKHAAIALSLQLNWVSSRPSLSMHRDINTANWLQVYYLQSQLKDIPARRAFLSGVWTYGGQAWRLGFVEDCDTFVAKLTEVSSVETRSSYTIVPPYFLTERKVASVHHNGPAKTRKGHCDHQEASKLQLLLDLPALENARGSLAYCSMSGDALNLVDEADKGPSATLKQAAIMEGIFVW
jgi:hypothetical protein